MTRVRNLIFAAVVAIAFIVLALVLAFGSVLSRTDIPANAAEKVVYLSGNAGIDTNDGNTQSKAVKTFARAKQILDGADGRIVVTGQINVTADSDWAADDGQKIKVVRGSSLPSKMIAVYAGATLYIKDIEISGGGVSTSTDNAYLIDIDKSGRGGKLAVSGRVKINDAADGMNVHLPENSVIEVRGALTAGDGAISIKSDNGIGGTVFEHKIAEGTNNYEVTEKDARAFSEVADLTHDNIIISEVKENSVLFSVAPENRMTVSLRQETVDGELISEDGFTVVRGSLSYPALAFLSETDGIFGVPKNLTHVESVTIDGGENLVVKKSDGDPEENNNEVVEIRGSFGKIGDDSSWIYQPPSVEKNTVIVVKYAPDAFSVDFDNRGGIGSFKPYLVPYGTPDPDRYGADSVSEYAPERSGYVYSGYSLSDGADYSTMPAHSISYKAGWRIKDIEIEVSGADTVKIGHVIVLNSNSAVYSSVQYSYHWYKDGTLLADENDRMLILSEVEQSGSYVLQIIAVDPLGYAPALSVTSAAVSAKIERYGAGQEGKPDVPPTDIETDEPLPENAVLTIESLSAKDSRIKTPLGYRAAGRFVARLTADGKEITPKKKVTVKVRLDGALLSDDSLTLVMIGKDGLPTYREFRVENGILIFETDSLGEFAIFVKTAVPWWAWIIIACGVAALVAAAVIIVVYKKMRTISFDTDGGTAVKKKYILAGHRVPKLPIPEKNGADFAGWYLDEEKTQSFDYKTMPKADITLFAKWRPKFGGKNDANA